MKAAEFVYQYGNGRLAARAFDKNGILIAFHTTEWPMDEPYENAVRRLEAKMRKAGITLED